MTDKDMRNMMRAAVEAAAEKAAAKTAAKAIEAQQSATITVLARELRIAGWQERDASAKAVEGDLRQRLQAATKSVEGLTARVEELEDLVRKAADQVDKAVEETVRTLVEEQAIADTEQQRQDEREIAEAVANAEDFDDESETIDGWRIERGDDGTPWVRHASGVHFSLLNAKEAMEIRVVDGWRLEQDENSRPRLRHTCGEVIPLVEANLAYKQLPMAADSQALTMWAPPIYGVKRRSEDGTLKTDEQMRNEIARVLRARGSF